jgi:hypothetical protein
MAAFGRPGALDPYQACLAIIRSFFKIDLPKVKNGTGAYPKVQNRAQLWV